MWRQPWRAKKTPNQLNQRHISIFENIKNENLPILQAISPELTLLNTPSQVTETKQTALNSFHPTSDLIQHSPTKDSKSTIWSSAFAKDLVLQVSHTANAKIHNRQTWHELCTGILAKLHEMKSTDIASLLRSLAQVQYRDAIVLRGLSETLYWITTSHPHQTVNDIPLILDSFRKLRYRPPLLHLQRFLSTLEKTRESNKWSLSINNQFLVCRSLYDLQYLRTSSITPISPLFSSLLSSLLHHLPKLKTHQLAACAHFLQDMDYLTKARHLESLTEVLSSRVEGMSPSTFCSLLKIYGGENVASISPLLLSLLNSYTRQSAHQIPLKEALHMLSICASHGISSTTVLSSLGKILQSNLGNASLPQVAEMVRCYVDLGYPHSSLFPAICKYLTSFLHSGDSSPLLLTGEKMTEEQGREVQNQAQTGGELERDNVQGRGKDKTQEMGTSVTFQFFNEEALTESSSSKKFVPLQVITALFQASKIFPVNTRLLLQALEAFPRSLEERKRFCERDLERKYKTEQALFKKILQENFYLENFLRSGHLLPAREAWRFRARLRRSRRAHFDAVKSRQGEGDPLSTIVETTREQIRKESERKRPGGEEEKKVAGEASHEKIEGSVSFSPMSISERLQLFGASDRSVAEEGMRAPRTAGGEGSIQTVKEEPAEKQDIRDLLSTLESSNLLQDIMEIESSLKEKRTTLTRREREKLLMNMKAGEMKEGYDPYHSGRTSTRSASPSGKIKRTSSFLPAASFVSRSLTKEQLSRLTERRIYFPLVSPPAERRLERRKAFKEALEDTRRVVGTGGVGIKKMETQGKRGEIGELGGIATSPRSRTEYVYNRRLVRKVLTMDGSVKTLSGVRIVSVGNLKFIPKASVLLKVDNWERNAKREIEEMDRSKFQISSLKSLQERQSIDLQEQKNPLKKTTTQRISDLQAKLSLPSPTSNTLLTPSRFDLPVSQSGGDSQRGDFNNGEERKVEWRRGEMWKGEEKGGEERARQDRRGEERRGEESGGDTKRKKRGKGQKGNQYIERTPWERNKKERMKRKLKIQEDIQRLIEKRKIYGREYKAPEATNFYMKRWKLDKSICLRPFSVLSGEKSHPPGVFLISPFTTPNSPLLCDRPPQIDLISLRSRSKLRAALALVRRNRFSILRNGALDHSFKELLEETFENGEKALERFYETPGVWERRKTEKGVAEGEMEQRSGESKDEKTALVPQVLRIEEQNSGRSVMSVREAQILIERVCEARLFNVESLKLLFQHISNCFIHINPKAIHYWEEEHKAEQRKGRGRKAEESHEDKRSNVNEEEGHMREKERRRVEERRGLERNVNKGQIIYEKGDGEERNRRGSTADLYQLLNDRLLLDKEREDLHLKCSKLFRQELSSFISSLNAVASVRMGAHVADTCLTVFQSDSANSFIQYSFRKLSLPISAYWDVSQLEAREEGVGGDRIEQEEREQQLRRQEKDYLTRKNAFIEELNGKIKHEAFFNLVRDLFGGFANYYSSLSNHPGLLQIEENKLLKTNLELLDFFFFTEMSNEAKIALCHTFSIEGLVSLLESLLSIMHSIRREGAYNKQERMDSMANMDRREKGEEQIKEGVRRREEIMKKEKVFNELKQLHQKCLERVTIIATILDEVEVHQRRDQSERKELSPTSLPALQYSLSSYPEIRDARVLEKLIQATQQTYLLKGKQ